MFTSNNFFDPYHAPVGHLGNFTGEEREKDKVLRDVNSERGSFLLSHKFKWQR